MNRYADPNQPLDHEGNPEDGPRRYIDVDPSKPPTKEHREWIARRRRERRVAEALAGRKPHRAGQMCVGCGEAFWPASAKKARDGVCEPCIAEREPQRKEQFA